MTVEQVQIGNALIKEIGAHQLEISRIKAVLLVAPETETSSGFRTDMLKQEQDSLAAAEKALADL